MKHTPKNSTAATKETKLPEEHYRAANVRQPDDYLQAGEAGLPDDPFNRPKGNQFLPPVCNKCAKPPPNGQSLNRYGTCKACEAIMQAANRQRQQVR
jgi:hypothetical protein